MDMEDGHNLSEFAAILRAKGYTDNFHTGAAYPDPLEESIRQFLHACSKGEDELRNNEFLLSCYIKWSGEDKPHVFCWMTVSYKNENLRLTEMNIERKDEYGRVFKECNLTFKSTEEIPEKSKAISLVQEPMQKKMRGSRL